MNYKYIVQQNSGRYILHIITLSDLSFVIEKKLNIEAEKAREYATIIMDLFGFDDRIIDNVLEHEERQLFYILESEGILHTEREEISLHDGRIWRIHYWLLKKNKILDYTHNKKWIKQKDDKLKIPDFEQKTIYSSLPKYMWTARKS